MSAETARQASALPPGAVLRADGAVELFMTAYPNLDAFDAAGHAVVDYLAARRPDSAPPDFEFEHVPVRRVTIIRVVERLEA